MSFKHRRIFGKKINQFQVVKRVENKNGEALSREIMMELGDLIMIKKSTH